jgi:hypothetical protein
MSQRSAWFGLALGCFVGMAATYVFRAPLPLAFAQETKGTEPREADTKAADTKAAEAAANPKPEAKPAEVSHPPRLNFWHNSWVKLRGADESEFSDKTKKVGYEILFDNYADTCIYAFPELNAVAACQARPTYELKTISINNTYHALRYNVRSGETWRWIGKSQWTKVNDPEPHPNGMFDLQLVSTGASFGAIRINLHSGQTWYLETAESGDTWKALAEPK